MEDFFSNDEYERKIAARKARVIAEQKRQARNRKIFFGSILLIVFIVVIVVVVNIIRINLIANSKNDANSDIDKVVELLPEEINGDFDPEEEIVNGNGMDDSFLPSLEETSLDVDESSNQSIVSGEYDFRLSNLSKKYVLDAYKYSYSSSQNLKNMSSDEYLSEYGIMIDVDEKTVIASKDGYAKMYPASMTKVMTVLTAWQYLSEADLDRKVTIPSEAIAYDLKNGCSSAGFEEGEVVTVRDLFYGTILPSGADAAYTLALVVAGSHDKFVELMNENARDLGISETTHFTNCVGIYDDNLYTTCYDMAVILDATLSDSFLSELMDARKYTTTVSGFHEEGIELSNWFLRRIEDKDTGGYVCAAKTGFVNESGCCGVSMMKANNGKKYICVSGKAWSSWRCIYDHVAAYNIYAVGNTGYHKG